MLPGIQVVSFERTEKLNRLDFMAYLRSLNRLTLICLALLGFMAYLRWSNRFILMSLALLGLSISSVSVVPIPAAVWLFGTGLIGLVGFTRRKIKV
jgi:hypothetical protein